MSQGRWTPDFERWKRDHPNFGGGPFRAEVISARPVTPSWYVDPRPIIQHIFPGEPTIDTMSSGFEQFGGAHAPSLARAHICHCVPCVIYCASRYIDGDYAKDLKFLRHKSCHLFKYKLWDGERPAAKSS